MKAFLRPSPQLPLSPNSPPHLAPGPFLHSYSIGIISIVILFMMISISLQLYLMQRRQISAVLQCILILTSQQPHASVVYPYLQPSCNNHEVSNTKSVIYLDLTSSLVGQSCSSFGISQQGQDKDWTNETLK